MPSPLNFGRGAALFADVLRVVPDFSKAAFARRLGVDKSSVTRWSTGELETPWWVVEALARYLAEQVGPTGAVEAVFGDLLARLGLRLVEDGGTAPDPAQAGAELAGALATLIAAHARATAPSSDGGAAITRREWGVLGPLLDQAEPALADMQRLRASARRLGAA